MKIYPDTKVFIVCPGNIYTGGAESCHQLASKLISLGVQTFMCYRPTFNDNFDESNPVHGWLKKYHVPYTFELEDESQNILIAADVACDSLYSTKNIRKIILWQSLDDYISHITTILQDYSNKPLTRALPKFFYFGKEDSDIEHWVQSEYMRQFVKLNGIPDEKIHMVEDYLDSVFLSRAAQVDFRYKGNVIAYNPAKGFEVTQRLIQFAPIIDWISIEGMTPAQIQELFSMTKVYIDFGNHSDRDKILRAAAISGCVVITGKRGAAANDIDINIPDEFKFEEQSIEIWEVIKSIRDIFADFETAYKKQAAYRARILDEKNRFTKEIEDVFETENCPLQSVALVQGLNEKSFQLAKKISEDESLRAEFVVDDTMTTENAAEVLGDLIIRKQGKNFVSDGQNLIEIITRDDAKLLYNEGRIKKFALLEPDDTELAEFKNFYAPTDGDILILEGFVKEESENPPFQSVALVQGLNEKSFQLAKKISEDESLRAEFVVDDTMSTENAAEVLGDLIIRKQGKNFISDGQNLIEIITRDDAKLLYNEGRIKKFALLEPDDTELAEFKNFYAPTDEDILILEGFVKEESENPPFQSVALVQGLNEKSFQLAKKISENESLRAEFVIDDTMSTENAAEVLDDLIIRKQGKNFVSDGQNLIEIITRDDAKLLYNEGRIKKFALLEPDDTELEELKNFYAPIDGDILILEGFVKEESENPPIQSVALVQGLNEKSFQLAKKISEDESLRAEFVVDDTMTTENAAEVLGDLIIRKQGKNFVSDGQNLIEIITRDDAKLLYNEGRIKKFALLEPDDTELEELKNFYAPTDGDTLVFNH